MIDNCSKHCQNSFEDLQKVFLIAPLLGYSYFTLPFCGENGNKYTYTESCVIPKLKLACFGNQIFKSSTKEAVGKVYK